MDDILSFEAGSLGDGFKEGHGGSLSSLPDLQIKPEPLLLTDAEIHALAKDRQKKDNHNMSEFKVSDTEVCITCVLTKLFRVSIVYMNKQSKL